MAVTAFVYGAAQKNFAAGAIDWGTHTIKVALLTSGYTPDQDTHEFFSSVSANEHAATGGYTAGGKTLTGKTSTYTSGTNTQTLDADDAVWTSSTLTARYAAVYRDTGTGSTSPLIVLYDFGANESSSGNDFTISFAATGIVTFVTA